MEYFVSYYDYYQPEAYVPSTDTFIEKDSSINEEIEQLKLAATGSLISRNDVIVIASVSCIYGLGSPDDFRALSVEVQNGQQLNRDQLLLQLVEALYNRNDIDLRAGRFRVRGDIVDIFPAYTQQPLRIEFWGDEIEHLSEFDLLTGETIQVLDSYRIYPANQYVTTKDKIERACKSIEKELNERVDWFEKQGLLLEAQRIRMRTEYDLEMLREIGFCNGIENYSRHLSTGSLVRDRGVFSISFLIIFWFLSMRVMSRFLNSVACTMEIWPENKSWWILDSAYLQPLIIAH